MKTTLKHCLTLGTLMALTAVVFAGDKPLHNADTIVPFDSPVDRNGDPLSDPDGALYNSYCPSGPNPVVTPDGHPITLGEWTKARGSASMKCNNQGTHVSLHAKGLIPGGVYTVWVVAFGPGPATPDGSNLLGIGALGSGDGSNNHFRASESGEGQLSVIHTATALAGVPVEEVPPFVFGPCLLDDPRVGEVLLVLLYHMNGQTYGSVPAATPPDLCSSASPLALSFKP